MQQCPVVFILCIVNEAWFELQMKETVNTVCLGLSSVQSVMVLSMVFGEDYGFCGKDEGFLAKIMDFLVKIMDFFLCQCLAY